MTLHEVLVKSHTVLEHQTASPWHEAECLVGLSLGVSREALIRVPLHEPIPGFAERRLQDFLHKRSTGVPLPYLLGHQGFYGLEFLVTPSVLIPRSETEVLLDVALQCIGAMSFHFSPIRIVDLGTGSGCMIVSVVKKLQMQCPEVPLPEEVGLRHIKFFATDISPQALEVARTNARLHKVASRIKFLQGDLLQPLRQKPQVILANLPYLTPAQIAENPYLRYEPQSALIAGHDGFSLYRRLLQDVHERAWSGLSMLLEIDPAQKALCQQEVTTYFPHAAVDFVPDLHGFTRVARITV